MIATLVIIAMAANRLWALWFFSEIFKRPREILTARSGWLGYLASCQFCVTIWAGFAATFLWLISPLGQWFDISLAASLLIFTIEKVTSSLDSFTEHRK